MSDDELLGEEHVCLVTRSEMLLLDTDAAHKT